MISSVTKLTLYAMSLVAIHKDRVEKRDVLSKRIASPTTGLILIECANISRDNDSLHE